MKFNVCICSTLFEQRGEEEGKGRYGGSEGSLPAVVIAVQSVVAVIANLYPIRFLELALALGPCWIGVLSVASRKSWDYYLISSCEGGYKRWFNRGGAA